MSVTVRHLNGDSTFLLLFSPDPKPTSSTDAYSVLIDPWLIGSSIVNAKWFSITDRVEPSAIAHLSELQEPDLVICSQNKPDHTHKETLLQLRPEGKTIIAAEPGAAKAIRSWNHFDPNRVHSLVKYDPKARFGNSLRIYIPPLSTEGLPGEVVISFIPAKNYVTGLHNAIGITYQAPTKSMALAPVTTIDLPKPKYFHLPMTPSTVSGVISPQQSPTQSYEQPNVVDSQETVVPLQSSRRRPSSLEHRPQLSRSSKTASSELLSFPDQPPIRPSLEEFRSTQPEFNLDTVPMIHLHSDTRDFSRNSRTLPTPPDSPRASTKLPLATAFQSNSFTPKSSISSVSNTTDTDPKHHSRILSASNKPPHVYPAKAKAISVLYSPHGIDICDIKPYVQNHLLRLPGALPLTLLLHSFEFAQNPWYFGGNIMKGAAGGICIAKALMARCWISAHDEDKDKRGISIKLLKTEYIEAEEIRKALASDEDGRRHGWTCDVRSLPCGKELCLSSNERDLLVGSKCEDVKEGVGLDNLALLRSAMTSIAG